jgi:hypothetical protein
MNENPYQSPMADLGPAVGVLSGKQADVRAVALYQKGVLVCILLYFCCILGQIAAQFVLPPSTAILFGLGVIVAGLAGLVFVFLMATKVYGVGIGIAMGVLTLMPCLGLIVLLLVNGKATKVLQQNGFRVGLLGANLSEVEKWARQGAE